MTQVRERADFESTLALARHEFDQIRELAYRTFGLELKPGKEELVASRLGRLVRQGGFGTFQEYYRHVITEPTGQSLAAMVDALATNHTSFLREPEHFQFLRTQVAPWLATRDVVEVWCAACSTGEEAWTLAIVLNDVVGEGRVRIIASDISRKALTFAERAVYSLERCESLPSVWLSSYFTAEGCRPKSVRVSDRIRSQVTFRRINLIQQIRRRREFPVIFCRNVMIYFDQSTQVRVVKQLAECLETGGYLFVGHAESLARISHGLEYVRPTVYRKPQKRGDKWK